MKSGRLSFSKSEKGRRQIDVAELERLYPKRGQEDRDKLSIAGKTEKTFYNEKDRFLEKHIELLEERLKEKNNEIESWKEALDKAHSTADKITKLLEHKPKESYQKSEKEIDELKYQVKALAKQNQRLLEIEEKREQQRMDARRKARLEQEKRQKEENRGFFSKLFGN